MPKALRNPAIVAALVALVGSNSFWSWLQSVTAPERDAAVAATALLNERLQACREELGRGGYAPRSPLPEPAYPWAAALPPSVQRGLAK